MTMHTTLLRLAVCEVCIPKNCPIFFTFSSLHQIKLIYAKHDL